MPSLNSIAPDKLVRLIGTSGAPTIIDVRTGEGSYLIPSGVRLDAGSVEQWAMSVAASTVVVVDEDGKSAAHGVAAWLRTEGVNAEALEGGFAGWEGAGLPLLPSRKLPRRDAQGCTLWVTRARPKVDRVA